MLSFGDAMQQQFALSATAQRASYSTFRVVAGPGKREPPTDELLHARCSLMRMPQMLTTSSTGNINEQ